MVFIDSEQLVLFFIENEYKNVRLVVVVTMSSSISWERLVLTSVIIYDF